MYHLLSYYFSVEFIDKLLYIGFLHICLCGFIDSMSGDIFRMKMSPLFYSISIFLAMPALISPSISVLMRMVSLSACILTVCEQM